MSRSKRNALAVSLLGIAPAVLILVAFRAYPLGSVIYNSFTNWDGLFKHDFIGVRNYVRIFRADYFWTTLVNCFIMFINVPIQILVGLVVSMLLYEKTLGWRFFRSLYYLPQIVSAVIVGYLFAIFFSYGGPVNTVLRFLGASGLAIEWLGSRPTAIGVVISALVWINIGWQIIWPNPTIPQHEDSSYRLCNMPAKPEIHWKWPPLTIGWGWCTKKPALLILRCWFFKRHWVTTNEIKMSNGPGS